MEMTTPLVLGGVLVSATQLTFQTEGLGLFHLGEESPEVFI